MCLTAANLATVVACAFLLLVPFIFWTMFSTHEDDVMSKIDVARSIFEAITALCISISSCYVALRGVIATLASIEQGQANENGESAVKKKIGVLTERMCQEKNDGFEITPASVAAIKDAEAEVAAMRGLGVFSYYFGPKSRLFNLSEKSSILRFHILDYEAKQISRATKVADKAAAAAAAAACGGSGAKRKLDQYQDNDNQSGLE